jgi:hypothetical protein
MNQPFSMLLLGAISFAGVAQTPDMAKWNTVDRTCGKLEWVEETLAKGSQSEFNEKKKPLRKTEVRLYSRSNESECCGTGQPLTRTVTRGDGSFEFKSVPPGSYWFVVTLEAKEYSLAIKFDPDANKREKNEGGCADLVYEVKNSQLQLVRVITVD